MLRRLIPALAFVLLPLSPVEAQDLKGWPSGVREVRYPSAADKTEQPALYYSPEGKGAVPLIVGLHPWSGDYRNTYGVAYAKWCVEHGWAFIHPNFRGANKRPEACGSELAVEDIASAVEWAASQRPVDRSRVYAIGVSGGGHAALLMAGRRPDLWAGVSAWVGISDLSAWHTETKKAGRKYWRDLEASCGGAPGLNADVDREYRQRSPLTWLEAGKAPPLDINAGIRDGHDGSVPISHSLLAFNKVAAEKDRVALQDIRAMTASAKVPAPLLREIPDPAYGDKHPLFRAESGTARVTIFHGGHEIISEAALDWLSKQRR